jgi:hypothetical protein
VCRVAKGSKFVFHGTYPFDQSSNKRSPAQLTEHRHFSAERNSDNGMVDRVAAPTATYTSFGRRHVP